MAVEIRTDRYPIAADVALWTDLSNIVAMVDAAYAIALNDTGITWGGSTEWNFPEPNGAITPPHLAVVLDGFLEYLVGYASVGQYHEPADEIQQRWSIGAYALYPYEVGARETYTSPLDCAVRLQAAFRSHANLDGQCDIVRCGPPMSGPVAERRPGDPPGAASGPVRWYGGYITIAATEFVRTEYQPGQFPP